MTTESSMVIITFCRYKINYIYYSFEIFYSGFLFHFSNFIYFFFAYMGVGRIFSHFI